MNSKPFPAVIAGAAGAVSLAAFAYAVAGTVLASRQRSNPVGWFLLGIGLVTAGRGLAGEYVRYALAGPSHASAVWAAWYLNWALIVLFPDGLLTFLLLLFPTGRPLTRRWSAPSEPSALRSGRQRHLGPGPWASASCCSRWPASCCGTGGRPPRSGCSSSGSPTPRP